MDKHMIGIKLEF